MHLIENGNAQKEAVGPLVTYFLVLEGLRSISCLLSKDLGRNWRTLRLKSQTLYTQTLVKAPISVNDETFYGMRMGPRHNSRIQNSPLMMILVRGKAM